jgi:predicted dehydrogenase
MGSTESYGNRKIGIIGLGSIGRKHAICLFSLGVKNIIALRTKKGSKQELSPEVASIKEVYDYTTFFNCNLDGVLICNPTSLHLDAMNQCLERDIPIFVEKPVFSELEQSSYLIQGKSDNIMIGFCLRFHPIIKKTHSLLHENKVGKISFVKLEVGQYLPSWHPYTDYRTEYFSRKELGGGALRTLSHEIDLMIHFFGTPLEFNTKALKVSELEIDVDDYATVLAQYKNHRVELSMDFITRKTKRTGSIVGNKGELQYDFIAQKIDFTNNKGETETIPFGTEELYLSQMEDFLDFIKLGKTKGCTFEEAMETMKIIDAENK